MTNNPQLVSDNAQFLCNKGQQGLAGKLYFLQAPSDPSGYTLPSLDAMQPIGEVDALTLSLPKTPFEQGFPGVKDRLEWFAIAFFAQLDVPQDGAYLFQSNSDDGSNVFIDGQQVVSNDGVHAMRAVASSPVQLTKGPHALRVDWFQGPKIYIGLELTWQPPGTSGFVGVPATAMTHGTDCKLTNVGTFPSGP